MSNVHHLIARHGAETAKQLAKTQADLREVNIAGAMLAIDDPRLGICHAGFALTSLPHKDIGGGLNGQWWREGHRTTLLVETGYNQDRSPVGIPYGSNARKVLIYLQTRALQTRCRTIELGRSMRSWMTAMDITSIGGATYKGVAEQARRISACRLTFFTTDDGVSRRDNGAFVDNAIELTGAINPDQGTLWREEVTLNEAFYRSLLAHPVPVSADAIRLLGDKSLSIDIYIWLAYRLHVINTPITVNWAALAPQFGAGCTNPRSFKPTFLKALRTALAAYPDAKVDVESGCIRLHPSRPPIPKLVG